jgi:hypothetical protein
LSGTFEELMNLERNPRPAQVASLFFPAWVFLTALPLQPETSRADLEKAPSERE